MSKIGKLPVSIIPVAEVSDLPSTFLEFFTAARGSYDFLLASKAAFFGSTFFAFDRIFFFWSEG